MHGDDIMTVEEVARYLKMKPQTVYKWAQQGQIPGTKLGKEWRFRRRILDEWIDASDCLVAGRFRPSASAGPDCREERGRGPGCDRRPPEGA